MKDGPTPQERMAVRQACTRWLSHGAKPHNMAAELARLADRAPDDADASRYGDNTYARAFEAEIAELLGKQAAVFMPSGTMAQPIALRVWSEVTGSKRIAFHPTCHLELHEHRAYSELHGLQATLLGQAQRLFTLEDLQKVPHRLGTVLVELPQREIGGQLPTWDELVALTDWAREEGIRLHLDGARLWECGPFYGRPLADIAGLFDSVYVSFYKTLGGIAGAVLAGPDAFIEESKVWLRRHGGNLVFQYPFIVSARIGIEQQLPQVPAFVERAARAAKVFGAIDGVTVRPAAPPTNLMHVCIRGDKDALETAALEVAKETSMWLFSSLRSTDVPGVWKTELTIGPDGLEISDEELSQGMREIVRRAQQQQAGNG